MKQVTVFYDRISTQELKDINLRPTLKLNIYHLKFEYKLSLISKTGISFFSKNQNYLKLKKTYEMLFFLYAVQRCL